jgi:hypothetical protein
MKNAKDVDRVIEKRWPKLKKRAQNERNPGKLIAILEEIEDLLFLMDMRIAAHYGSVSSRADAASRSATIPVCWDGGPGNSELKGQ